MTEKAKKYLADIRQAIELLERFTGDTTDFFDYQKDLKTKSAVERQLGIIGEAVNKFRKEEENVVLSHTRQIVDFRNRLIHSYDNMDDTMVWAILKRHIPILEKEVGQALEEE
ncbi:MAG: HepT-like ribonuclease domain-containing protein [Saprospiraceae bacterium]